MLVRSTKLSVDSLASVSSMESYLQRCSGNRVACLVKVRDMHGKLVSRGEDHRRENRVTTESEVENVAKSCQNLMKK